MVTKNTFNGVSTRTLVKVSCDYCGIPTYKRKHDINFNIKAEAAVFCSKDCWAKYQTKRCEVPCSFCKKPVIKKQVYVLKFNTSFCNRSCSASYHNKYTANLRRRSKVEIRVADSLQVAYPNIPVSYNDRSNGFEIDIFYPTLKLGIELNGSYYHSEQSDTEKFNKCKELGIVLIQYPVNFYINSGSGLYYALQDLKQLIDSYKCGEQRTRTPYPF